MISDATNLKRQFLIDITQNKGISFERYKSILEKSKNGFLSINNGKYSGYLEIMIEALYNLGYIQGCKDENIAKVKFYAIEDSRTTKMCNSLNEQEFYVEKRNKFKRYSEEAKGEIEYDVLGMILGVNLPPIDDNFHYCRSWVVAI